MHVIAAKTIGIPTCMGMPNMVCCSESLFIFLPPYMNIAMP
jgi:hypothetical protein